MPRPKTKRYYRIVERLGQTESCFPPSKWKKRSSISKFFPRIEKRIIVFSSQDPTRRSLSPIRGVIHTMRNGLFETPNQSHESKTERGDTTTLFVAGVNHTPRIYLRESLRHNRSRCVASISHRNTPEERAYPSRGRMLVK